MSICVCLFITQLPHQEALLPCICHWASARLTRWQGSQSDRVVFFPVVCWRQLRKVPKLALLTSERWWDGAKRHANHWKRWYRKAHIERNETREREREREQQLPTREVFLPFAPFPLAALKDKVRIKPPTTTDRLLLTDPFCDHFTKTQKRPTLNINTWTKCCCLEAY